MDEAAELARFNGLAHGLVRNHYWDDGYDDALQEVRIGILQALRSYRPDCGASLNTWVTWRARGAIRDHIRQVTGRRSTNGELRVRRVATVALDDVYLDPETEFDPVDRDPDPAEIAAARVYADQLRRRVATCSGNGDTPTRSARRAETFDLLLAGWRPTDIARRDGVTQAALTHRLRVLATRATAD